MDENLKKYVIFINESFDAAKEKLNLRSDAALADWLGVTRMGVSQYRKGQRLMSDWLLIRLCTEVGHSVFHVLSIILKYKPLKQEAKEGVQFLMDKLKGEK